MRAGSGWRIAGHLATPETCDSPRLALFAGAGLPILRALPLGLAAQSSQEDPPMQSLQVVYRATVMIGTLIVGALAYRAYGPQLEKLEPVVTRLREMAAEAWSPDTTSEPLAELQTPPAEFRAEAEPLYVPMRDAQVQPASTFPSEPSPLAEVPSADPVDEDPPVSSVVRELNHLGVTEYSLNPWGDGGQFYRFRCQAPWGDGGRYSRQFEAIAADPSEAARQVLAQVQQWQLAR